MKLGKSFPEVRQALSETNRLDRAFYVERASTDAQRVLPVADVDEASVPYFSLVMLPGAAAAPRTGGGVAVVGLGPGDLDWITPQARRELAAATDLIGYFPTWTGWARGPGRPASQRQHRRTRARPAGLRAGRPGPLGGGGVLR
jgi:precorrin-2 C20-methyltransferase/precorrin-3B C17-methyltransferase